MKHTVKRTLTTFLSLLLVLSLVLSLPLNAMAAGTASTPAPATAGVKDVNGDGKITYVSFGDSVTNGYGMDGYRFEDGTNVLGYDREVATAYPAMTAAYLKSQGFQVELRQLAISGFRMDELHWMLDMENYKADQYHNTRFGTWNHTAVSRMLKKDADFAAKYQSKYDAASDKYAVSDEIISGEYVKAVENADLITIDLGTNNFGTFLTSTIQYVLGLSKTPVVVDFAEYMDAKSAASLDEIIKQMAAQMVGSNAQAQEIANTLARCMMYGYLGFVNHYDAAIERIYALNPEAQVVVVDVYSMITGVDLTGDVFGDGIDLDELYNLFIDMVNLYAREQSPWATKVTHATLDSAPALFIDYYKEYEANRTNGKYKDSQFLHPTAERLMNEFIMEAMGSDPDDPEDRKQFEKTVLAPMEPLENAVANLKATIEENGIKQIKEGVAAAAAKVDEAVEGVEQADMVVDIIAQIIEENSEFKGSASGGIVKAIAVSKIEEELDAREDMMLQIGIEPTDENKAELAEKLYDVACTYYDVEASTGSEEEARKAADIEIMSYVLVKTQGMSEAEAQATAELAYELNTIYKNQGEKAATIAAIKSQSAYAGEGVAEAMYNIYAGKFSEADMVKVLALKGIPENVAKAIHACYTQNLDGRYENANVKTVALYFMVSSMGMDQATAESAYASYSQYKSVALTLSKIANCKDIYFDELLAAAAKGIDLDAIAVEFMNGTLKLDKPADNASAEEWAEYKSDSALAVLYFRFMTQDGVFTHPNEVGQEKMTKAVQNAVTKLNVAEADSDITLTKDSKVLVLGDFIAAAENGYVAEVIKNAASVGYETTNLSENDYRINEVRALLDTSYAGDAYTTAVLGNDKAALSKTYTEAVKGSDVILLHLGAMNMGYIAKQLDLYMNSGKTYAMKFAALESMSEHTLGQRVDAVLGEFQQGLTTNNTDAGALLAFESFNYGYATFVDCLDDTVETIQTLNPNADIILVGQYELMDGAYFDAQGIYLEMGEFINRGVTMMNGYMKTYAEMTDNVTYIDVFGTETLMNTQSGSVNMGTAEGFSKAFENTLPTANGSTYIAKRLSCALGGHPSVKGDITWNWSKGHTAATASYECGECGFDVKLNASVKEVREEFCTKEGTGTYTATVTIGGKAMTNVATAKLPATGHTFGEPAWSWEADGSKATAAFTCTVCKHVEKKDASVTSTTTAPTCDKTGKTVFTGSVTMEGKSYTNTKEVTIPANGHKYGAPVWTWAEDFSTASATFTCTVCKQSATEKATLSVEASAAPNCYVDGYKKHVAKVKMGGAEYTDRKQQTLPAAHNYVDGICTVCKTDINDYNVYRIYGDNRYQTAFGVADALKEQMGVEKFDAIIVASGSKFADALAGSYLAAVKNAPILVTNENNKQLVKVYIAQNLADGGTLYILGGPNAVNANFDSDMTAYFNVKRLEGVDRYETNLKILQEAGLKSGDEILVCTGKKFADSLSASAVGKPILLVKDSLYDTQKAYLEAMGKNFKFTIIGGESAISAELEEQLKAYGTTERIGGANRYETSTLVAERYFKEPETVVVAYGRKFPDGLCGGPLAYYLNAPLLLTQAGSEAAADAYTDKYGIITGYVLGGEAVIEDQTIKTIFEIKDEEDRLVAKKTAFSMEDSFTGSMGDIDPGLLEDLIGTLFPGANVS